MPPADAELAKALEGIVARHHADAAFWAKYLGAVAGLIAQLFPVRPLDADHFDKSFRYVVIRSIYSHLVWQIPLVPPPARL